MNTGKCIAPIIVFECGNPDNCPEYFNQDNRINFNYPWATSKVAAMHHY
jgi:hypothetical protein